LKHGLEGFVLPQNDFGEIHLLSFFGLQKMMSQLLQVNHGADLKDNWGQTPISHAATGGHSKVVQLLVTQDHVDVNLKGRYSHSPLLYATRNGHLEVMKLLLA
jgi:ankyrin repeat protein